MSKGLKITLIAVASSLFVLVLVCSGVGYLVYRNFGEQFVEPQNIAIAVKSPDRVKPREAFTIEITIANSADEAQTLDSIDIYDTYLKGVRMQRSNPAWSASATVGDFVTYNYQLEIPARGELVVKFDARAIGPGDYAGDFDVCINNELSYLTEVVRTNVDEEGTSAVPPSQNN
jgi:Na+-transporting methylmalonyl-CoA/oxaloacetate decarboxylase gamma subunit